MTQQPEAPTPAHYLVDEHYPTQPDLRALAAAADKHGQHIYTHWRDSNAAKANAAWCNVASPELVISLLDRIAALEAQQTVPHGWKLAPMDPTEAQLATVRNQKSHPCAPDRWDSNNRRIYMRMLAAAPLPPGDAPQHLTDGEIIAAQESLIAAKDALYRSRIGLQCSHCKKGTYRADGNGYYDFHRCDQCRYVPMWNQDSTEFGYQEKPNGPSI
ncbi:hypothetical protein GL58_10720 [Comamonas testosteroni]|uniref:Uncharacterized protein n=1 Tax=Comamonas testosteroni TaxID=285 RepID=A0A0L7MHW7_COMTE|nr:hypothetical protein [Comamonas testosteroni]KOC21158.1 hypothetical protein GL58_10720 [Comamonas testosteroni]